MGKIIIHTGLRQCLSTDHNGSANADLNHEWHKHQRTGKTCFKTLFESVVVSACRVGSLFWKVLVGGGRVERCGSKSAAASKGVVVAVLGLAEFVKEEDHGLQAQDQHYSTDEACGVKRVLVRFRRGSDCCGRGVACSCG